MMNMKIMVKNVIVSWIFNLVALHGWSIQASMLFLLALFISGQNSSLFRSPLQLQLESQQLAFPGWKI
jgi:hypothetical protein